MQGHLAAENDPQIRQALDKIQANLVVLQRHSRDDHVLFSTCLNAILAGWARLDFIAEKRYKDVAPLDAKHLLIDELELDQSKFLLVY
ncbi:hypothetical protein [Pseudomonas sp. Irchel s3f7]|uniref:hypothetical protein n=1 Tax=Pseudomonas sp. Irchel s3f7 TaxID=2009153 RepID=UPI000BA418A3|nr:hypothetical protein [Pseudomonas sp. Irchel s3f7]